VRDREFRGRHASAAELERHGYAGRKHELNDLVGSIAAPAALMVFGRNDVAVYNHIDPERLIE